MSVFRIEHEKHAILNLALLIDVDFVGQWMFSTYVEDRKNLYNQKVLFYDIVILSSICSCKKHRIFWEKCILHLETIPSYFLWFAALVGEKIPEI